MSLINQMKDVNIPSVKIIPVNSIEDEMTKSYGKIYFKRYFIKSPSSTTKMMRITSREKSMNKTLTIDFYNVNGEVVFGFELNNDLPTDKLTSLISKFSELKDINEKVAKTIPLNEARFPVNTGIMLLQLVPIIVAFMLLIKFYIKKTVNWKTERTAKTTLEEDINRSLFGDQKVDEPGYALYYNINNALQSIISGKLNACILCGPPGMSKTYSVRRKLHFSKLRPGIDYNIEKGSLVNLEDIYQLLWNNKNNILVLDDFDTPLKNPDMVNFLKAITDTYSKRLVSRPKEVIVYANNQTQKISDVPDKFEFKGKLIIITNLQKNDIDLALRSRCPVVEVNFDTKTVLHSINLMMKHMLPEVPMKYKVDVFNYINELYKKYPNKIKCDFRTFQSCVCARYSNETEWKELTVLFCQ